MNEILQQIPMGLIIGYLFIIGMCLGSFFLVVGWRVPKKESLLTRSHCDDCQQTLGARDLIPVLSYLILKGKCRKCQKKIPLIAFLYEVLIGMLFTGTTLLFWGTAEVIAAWCLLALLAIISASDIFYQLIPNKVLAPFFAGGIGLRLIQPQNEFWRRYQIICRLRRVYRPSASLDRFICRFLLGSDLLRDPNATGQGQKPLHCFWSLYRHCYRHGLSWQRLVPLNRVADLGVCLFC